MGLAFLYIQGTFHSLSYQILYFIINIINILEIVANNEWTHSPVRYSIRFKRFVQPAKLDLLGSLTFQVLNGSTSIELICLNFQQNFNGRIDKFLISNSARFKICKNILIYRLACIHNFINLDWINQVLFKLKCENLFLN